MMNNPMMRQAFASNPMMAGLLNNPEALRQQLLMARNMMGAQQGQQPQQR